MCSGYVFVVGTPDVTPCHQYRMAQVNIMFVLLDLEFVNSVKDSETA